MTLDANNRVEVSHQATRLREKKCVGSNLHAKHNDFYPHTASLIISFEWDATD
jgi:hypothetical protein